MAKEWAKSFYNSRAWLQCRESYIQSVYGLCEICTKNNKINNGYIVHHKTKLTPSNITDYNISLNYNNLQYLCLIHHNEVHGIGKGGEVIRDGLMFDSKGEIIEAPLK